MPLTQARQDFLTQQYLDLEQLYSSIGIAAYRGTTEDLSGVVALQILQNLNVGNCVSNVQTADQTALFANRNNVNSNELVVYLVQTLIGGAGNFVGCASFPAGEPGAAIVQINAQWLTAHELGHVLGLSHVATIPSTNSDFLMWPTTAWTNPPPDLSAAEAKTMLASSFSTNC